MRAKTTKKSHKSLNGSSQEVIDAVAEAKEKLGDIEKDVIKYAKHNPLRAMGFSVLAGLVLAQILHIHR